MTKSSWRTPAWRPWSAVHNTNGGKTPVKPSIFSYYNNEYWVMFACEFADGDLRRIWPSSNSLSVHCGRGAILCMPALRFDTTNDALSRDLRQRNRNLLNEWPLQHLQRTWHYKNQRKKETKNFVPVGRLALFPTWALCPLLFPSYHLSFICSWMDNSWATLYSVTISSQFCGRVFAFTFAFPCTGNLVCTTQKPNKMYFPMHKSCSERSFNSLEMPIKCLEHGL